jgi:hypothetical protein
MMLAFLRSLFLGSGERELARRNCPDSHARIPTWRSSGMKYTSKPAENERRQALLDQDLITVDEHVRICGDLRARLATAKAQRDATTLINEQLLAGGVDLHQDLVDIIAAISGECLANRRGLEITDAELAETRRALPNIAGLIRRASAADAALAAVREAVGRIRSQINGTQALRDIDAALAAVDTQPEPRRCSQCGNPYSVPACGPTHAVIAAEQAASVAESLGVAVPPESAARGVAVQA